MPQDIEMLDWSALSSKSIGELADLLHDWILLKYKPEDFLEDHAEVRIDTGLPDSDKYIGIDKLKAIMEVYFNGQKQFPWILYSVEFGYNEDKRQTTLHFRFRPKDTLEKLVRG